MSRKREPPVQETTRSATLARLALSGIDSTAEIESKEKALSKLAADHLAGRSTPIDLAGIHSELEVVASAETTSQRGLQAVWRAAQSLEALDAAGEDDQPEPPPEDDEPDPWFAVDLWSRLQTARGWDGRALTIREEIQLGRDWSRIMRAKSPAEALATYRRRFA